MAITLRPEHEQIIAAVLQTGAYQNADEVIARALELFHLENEWLVSQKTEIVQKIDRALEQFERGEYFSAEESIADLQKRKQEWLAQKKR